MSDVTMEEARKAALEAGWGHDTATLNRVLDVFVAKLSEGFMIVPKPTGETRDHDWEDHCGDLDCEICAPRF